MKHTPRLRGTMGMHRFCRFAMAAGLLFVVAHGSACSGGGGEGAGGASGGSATGGTAGGTGGAVGTGGDVGRCTVAATGGTTGAASTYPNIGVKGERGKATADATSFDGYEERFIIGEQGFGVDVCTVRFDLKRVGDAPGGCSDCLWTHLLEYSNPQVVTDTDGVCSKSDLALDAAAIAKIVGTRIAIGFAKELGGAHGSARMKYFGNCWDVAGNATWAETTKELKFDFRDGLCNYGP